MRARRFWPRSITAQIAVLVTAAVFLGDLLTSGSLSLLRGSPGSPDRAASRIAVVTELARAARTPEEVAALAALARRAAIAVEEVPFTPLTTREKQARSLFGRLIVGVLKSGWRIEPLSSPAGRSAESIVVPLGSGTALAFEPGADAGALLRIGGLTGLALLIVSLFVALVAVYAIHSITAPLSFIAHTARAFGHSPDRDETLPERGPNEIVRVARALNEMRARIRALIDDRTRMLAAISHDLRTPLTRLRLRAERVVDTESRDGMLRDIGLINELLAETLTYLRDGVRAEPPRPTDLSSLLQTICAEFTDVGHAVAYQGPQRLALACRPRALARAARNIVENGVKHGTQVVLRLCPPVERDGPVHIEICDNGPGIAPSIRNAVFEPFFKADSARTSGAGAGFGLGLSIARDIIRDHGGSIELLAGESVGLKVRISLPATAATSLNDT